MTDTTNNDEPTMPTREQIVAMSEAEVEQWMPYAPTSERSIALTWFRAGADAVLAVFSQPSPRTPSAEPDEVIPVADSSSGEHRKVLLYEGDDLPVCDTCTNSLGFNVRWDHAEKRHAEPVRIQDMAPGDVEDAALVDRVAAAIFEVRDDADDLRDWDEVDGDERERYQCDARAALAALNSNVTPPPALPEDGR